MNYFSTTKNIVTNNWLIKFLTRRSNYSGSSKLKTSTQKSFHQAMENEVNQIQKQKQREVTCKN